MLQHVNWGWIVLGVTTVARNSLTYMPVPGSVPGFVSGPWYPMIYHFAQGILALNPAGTVKMLTNGKPSSGQGG